VEVQERPTKAVDLGGERPLPSIARIRTASISDVTVEIGQLWEAATVLLALQITSFGWRINRESGASEKGKVARGRYRQPIGHVYHAVSLAAHYELFNVGKRSNTYFPLQEKCAVARCHLSILLVRTH
jgi:hypothetical protein